jgi:hypothetical protein
MSANQTLDHMGQLTFCISGDNRFDGEARGACDTEIRGRMGEIDLTF